MKVVVSQGARLKGSLIVREPTKGGKWIGGQGELLWRPYWISKPVSKIKQIMTHDFFDIFSQANAKTLSPQKAPILIHFDTNNSIIVEMDASDYTITTIISQITPSDGDIHLIAFYLHGLAPAKMNYEIYDKELLTIFGSFKQW